MSDLFPAVSQGGKAETSLPQLCFISLACHALGLPRCLSHGALGHFLLTNPLDATLLSGSELVVVEKAAPVRLLASHA